MTGSRFRTIALALVAAPLALGLAGCGKKDEAAATAPSGEPIAKVAAPAGKAWGDVVTKTPEGGYLMGNPAARIPLTPRPQFAPRVSSLSAVDAGPETCEPLDLIRRLEHRCTSASR